MRERGKGSSRRWSSLKRILLREGSKKEKEEEQEVRKKEGKGLEEGAREDGKVSGTVVNKGN